MKSLYSLILFTMNASVVAAQAPQVTALFPPGGVKGARTISKVEGANLGKVKAVYINGSGITANLDRVEKDGLSAQISFDISADAYSGPYEVRLLSPTGLSNPSYIWTGNVPELNEVEPNDTVAKAMKISSLPVCINGRMDAAEDVDWYEFSVAPGATTVIDIVTNRIYSPMDAVLDLRDAAGHIVAEASEGYDRDPHIVFTSKLGGIYRLQVRDTLYRGGKNFLYRLSIGSGPYVPIYVPSTLLPGKNGNDQVKLPEGTQSANKVEFDPNRTLNIIRYSGKVVPITAPLPGVGDLSATAGYFSKPRQIVPVKFDLQMGKAVQYRVVSRGVGSRAMVSARVLDPMGKEILNTDDQIGRDLNFTINPSVAGVYSCEISNVNGKYGDEYGFAVIARPNGVFDFSATVSPDAVVLGKGQSLPVTVNLERLGGFYGAVEVTASGIQKGVAVSPLIIPSGASSGIVVVTATGDLVPDTSLIEFHCTGRLDGGKTIVKTATPTAMLPRPGEGIIVPRQVAFGSLSVNGNIPLVTMLPESTTFAALQGASVPVKLKVNRKLGDNAALPAISVTVSGLPAGIAAELPQIAEKAMESAIKFNIAPTVAPGTYYLVLTGTMGKEVFVAPGIQLTVNSK